ncbi:hypothetical protein [Pleionea sediminis]|uniref:hypothetical protein n=1 Tax=Pleionea sediminis TaxID=2569479 RepID=UPI00118520FE|nr:hypothetical protein [Pleionea sediminis]
MISIIKKNLHRDICKIPELHAFVLNLYLNGEEYPHKVNDYFPIELIDEPEVVGLMKSHMMDEDRHVKMYKKAIRKLDQPIIELPMIDIYNHVIKNHTAESFHITKEDNKDIRIRKLANFMAHLHFLEKRISHSLKIHLDACTYSPVNYTEKVVGRVLNDENRHVEYTKNAVYDLLPRAQAKNVMTQHRLAECRASREFSYQQLRKVVTQYKHQLPKFNRQLYSISSHILEWSIKHVD